jgi:hypothetical protein
MTERIYTIGELKNIITESASEFKAKMGNNVTSSNEKENQKTYADSKKKIKAFDGGGDEIKASSVKYDKEDGNRTTLDCMPEEEVSSDFKEKVKAQAEGYSSTLEKNNKIQKSGEFSDKNYNHMKKAGKTMKKNVEDLKKRGLTASKAPEGTFKKNDLYEGVKKICVLNFKNTTFINESQMISLIPDDYKIEGKRFKVKDAGENEFIVEWTEGEATILSYENKKKLNEALDKFHKLSGYNSKDQFKKSTTQSRLNEDTAFNRILDNARIISEKQE